MDEESKALLVEQAKRSWAVPVTIWVLGIAINFFLGEGSVSGVIRAILAGAAWLGVAWGLYRGISSFRQRHEAPEVVKHAIAGILVCGIPLIVLIVVAIHLATTYGQVA